ncbi:MULTISPECIES: hypothetical protein [unclassified Variovorax]|jgi:hypothetical protein|uniref:DUF6900 domain-containing protein n=1 Tax=unclassified Variovorax TaxID=663243 RepID=UPI000F7F23F8|nr:MULTISPECIES: hypothetical protein [unclassified Variovorax]RSZ35064.1 hypothetical protein EJO70_24625 [Variovorax sp. 553]RSZ35918.1 hypothetical protein EJO71_25865 [Variovorax sp. 679]
MKTLFLAIAKKHFRIETLETRNRDALDFHEVSVWGIQAALQAAFDAGRQAAKNGGELAVPPAVGGELLKVSRRCSATEAYKIRSANITVLLAQLLDQKRLHAERAAKEPQHWGFAGDLAELEAAMRRAIAAVGGAYTDD